MAIIGIGCDLCDSTRVAKVLAKFGHKFENRVFTDSEVMRVAGREPGKKAAFYAKRFAAKEACLKALGTGIRNMRWRNVEVSNKASGQPTIKLYGRAVNRLHELIPPNHTSVIHLSISDEPPLAMATVIIEAIPE